MIGDAVACTSDQHVLGEGARWDARRGELLRVDIMDGLVFRDRVDNDGGLIPIRTYEVPGTVGAIIPVEGDEGSLTASNRGFVHLAPDGSLHPLVEVAPEGTRMNDASCDPQGRCWAGTKAHDNRAGGGALYRLDRDGHTRLMLDGLTISNGLGWSPDGATMYLADTIPRVIHPVAFDGERGTISNGRVLVTVTEGAGPDGLTVDAARATSGWRSSEQDASTGIALTVCFARSSTSPPWKPPPAHSRVRDRIASTSPPRPRIGATNSVSPSPPPGSPIGSTLMSPDVRRHHSVPIERGGPKCPHDTVAPHQVKASPLMRSGRLRQGSGSNRAANVRFRSTQAGPLVK